MGVEKLRLTPSGFCFELVQIDYMCMHAYIRGEAVLISYASTRVWFVFGRIQLLGTFFFLFRPRSFG